MTIELESEHFKLLSELTGLEILTKKSKAVSLLLEQGQINAINYLARQKLGQKLSLFEENNLFNVLVELRQALGLTKIPRRIECYDISHLSGTSVYGSMVVFIDGVATKSLYRAFKCPEVNDDFANHQHMLRRRLQKFWDLDREVETIQKALTKLESGDFEIENLDSPQVLSAIIQSDSDNFVAQDPDQSASEKFNEPNQEKIAQDKATISSTEAEFQEKIALRDLLTKKLLKAKQNLKDWTLPDLIIVDGGKGQLAGNWQVLQELDLAQIEMVSLAKKEEEIFTIKHLDFAQIINSTSLKKYPNQVETSFESSTVSNKSTPHQTGSQGGLLLTGPAKFLVQRIRDEAHRFGIKHNRKARLRLLSQSDLDKVVGPKTKIKLLTKFSSIANLIDNLSANEQLVQEVVGDKILAKLKKHFLF